MQRDPHLLADILRTIEDSESDKEVEQPKQKKRKILTGPVRKSKRLNRLIYSIKLFSILSYYFFTFLLTFL